MSRVSISKKNIKGAYLFAFLVVVVLLCIYFSFVQFDNFDNNDSTTLSGEGIKTLQEKELSNDIENSIPISNNDNSIMSNNTSTPLFNQLIEEGTEIEMQRLEATQKVPAHEWQLNLITNMKKEDIKQTIENLANFDDDMLASSSIESAGMSEKQSILVTRLMRVRKLYAIGLDNPNLIIPELQRAHKDSFKKWPEVYKKRKEDSENGRIGYSEPDGLMRVEYSCFVATYLLGEFSDYNSLPLLSQQYKKHHVWPPPAMPSPVVPSMTFYAMHRLVSSYPRESLSKEAIKALDEYLKDAKGLVPEPEQIKVTLHDDLYTEFDPRLIIVGVRNQILAGHESMTMPLYPTKFTDGTKISDGNAIKSEKADELFKKLDAFVQIVYPSDENTVP